MAAPPTLNYWIELELLAPQCFGNGWARHLRPEPHLNNPQHVYYSAKGDRIPAFKHLIDDHMNTIYSCLNSKNALPGTTTHGYPRNGNGWISMHAIVNLLWTKDGANPNTHVPTSLWRMSRGNADVRASTLWKNNWHYPFFTGFNLESPLLDTNDHATFTNVAKTINQRSIVVRLFTQKSAQFNVKVFPKNGLTTPFSQKDLNMIAAIIYIFRRELDNFHEPVPPRE